MTKFFNKQLAAAPALQLFNNHIIYFASYATGPGVVTLRTVIVVP